MRERWSPEKWKRELERTQRNTEFENSITQDRLMRHVATRPDSFTRMLCHVKYTTKGYVLVLGMSFYFYYPTEEQAIAKGVELTINGYAGGFHGNPDSA